MARAERGRTDGPAAALDRDVRELRTLWPGVEEDLTDLGLRTHEILENALEFQLTGHDDYGSGTTLATTNANITGTYELLGILRPLLVPRYRGLPSAYAWLSAAHAAAASSSPMAAGRRSAGSRHRSGDRSTRRPARRWRTSRPSPSSPSRGGRDGPTRGPPRTASAGAGRTG